jgi:integrase
VGRSLLKRPHAIPILPLAQRVLASLPERGPYFFAARWDDSGHLTSGAWSKLKREVQKLSGTSNWQIRDLRRTFRSNMARLKVPRDLCEVLLNHAPPILDEIYDRYDRLDEKRDALAKYEAHIQKLTES